MNKGMTNVLLLLLLPASAAISWTTTADGDWSFSCDFSGNDLSNALTPGSGCSGKCIATSGCTHYTWTDYMGGTCWMKSGAASRNDAIATSVSSMVCGILAGTSGGGGGISWKGDWANSCDWNGGDFTSAKVVASQCGPTCASTASCTHYTWTNYNGGTCWMKSGAVSKQNAVATTDPTMVCGLVTNPPPPPSGGRNINVRNNCPHPIWIATLSNKGHRVLPDGTVQLGTGQSHSYDMTSRWAGRMWPKTGCNANGQNCQFGDSQPPCPSTGCTPPGETLIEFNIDDAIQKQTWYDISLVDGYTLPVKITPRGVSSGSCIETMCAVDVASCPTGEPIGGLGDERVWRNGQAVACLAPCKKWNYPSPYGLGKPESAWPGPELCCSNGVMSPQCNAGQAVRTQYVNLVRRVCPTAYSFAYDDKGGLHSCPASTAFDVTFCP